MRELSLHILDILHNSLSAKATKIELFIEESSKKDIYSITIKDNGKGIPKEMLETVTDAYTTSRKSRKVGLGIPLFKMNAEISGGSLTINSEEGVGTELTAIFGFSNIDRLPLGDIEGCIVPFAASNKNLHFIYKHTTEKGDFTFDTKEIIQALDGMPLNNPKIILFLKEMVKENLSDIEIER